MGNPIEKATTVEEIVMVGENRKYYRFRFSKYYGGIITADTIGCNLQREYCWNFNRNQKPERHGRFYSSKEVMINLLELSQKYNVDLFRISGAEPVLGKNSMNHLVEVIKLLGSEFILETNGIMLGYIPELCDEISDLPIAVRVAIKGWDEKSLHQITGSEGKYWKYQIEALKNLKEREILAYPAVMYDLFRETGIQKIAEKLGISMEEIELEYLEVKK